MSCSGEFQKGTMLFAPKEKSQGLVEYALILALVAVVVIAVLLILGPIIGNLFSKINSNLSASGNEGSGGLPSSPIFSIAGLIKLLYTVSPIILPVFLALFTSLYDGTMEEVQTRSKIKKVKPGRLTAKLCLSGITFDIWGLGTTLQNEGVTPPFSITRTELGTFMFLLIIFHLGFHYLCLNPSRIKRVPENLWGFIRFVLVLVSISVPLSLLVPTNYFIIPK